LPISAFTISDTQRLHGYLQALERLPNWGDTFATSRPSRYANMGVRKAIVKYLREETVNGEAVLSVIVTAL
jgi:hypothetical protein